MEATERIAELNDFLHFALAEWPVLRSAGAQGLARRCKRCIVSERYSTLAGGVCAICRDGDASRAPAPRGIDTDEISIELDSLLRRHEGLGKKHDLLVMYSGGKDSTYLVHRLTTEYPRLRTLSVLVDNGFLSEVALSNARRVFAMLDADHAIVAPKRSLFRKVFRHALTHLDGGGCYSSVDRLDGELTFGIGRNLAAALEIPLVAIGISAEQCVRILGLHGFESPKELEALPRGPSEHGLEGCLDQDEALYWWDPRRWPVDRLPRVLFPFFAWQLPEQKIREEVVGLGLIPPGQENPLVTNSDLVPVMLAVDIAHLGYSGFEPEFAQMVREGKADRQWWLNVFEAAEYLARKGELLPRCIDDTLCKLQLTRRELSLP
jgi:hypothetical protein